MVSVLKAGWNDQIRQCGTNGFFARVSKNLFSGWIEFNDDAVLVHHYDTVECGVDYGVSERGIAFNRYHCFFGFSHGRVPVTFCNVHFIFVRHCLACLRFAWALQFSTQTLSQKNYYIIQCFAGRMRERHLPTVCIMPHEPLQNANKSAAICGTPFRLSRRLEP